MKYELLNKLKNSLVVSCQASTGEPLCHPSHIWALSQSAINGGAQGLRLEGTENILYARSRTTVPIVGLTKASIPDKDRLSSVYITPTFADALAISNAGSDIIAFDATARTRPDGSNVAKIIELVHAKLNKPVWADVSTYEEGIAAFEAGADVISTTLSGYTEETRVKPEETGPDLLLLEKLVKSVTCPVVLEGRVWLPEEVRKAFALGAFAVVVGSAITRPQLITERFVKVLPQKASKK